MRDVFGGNRRPQPAGGVDGAVQTAHRGVRLHHDHRGLPALAELRGQLRGVGVVALAEHAEEPAVLAFEDPLDAGVAAGGQTCGVEAVAGGEAVVHPLAHRLVLRSHQSGRLSAREAERVFQPSGGQTAELAGCHCGTVGAEHRSRVPAAIEHLGAVQRVSDPRAHLEAGDGRQQEVGAAGGRRPNRRGGEQRGNEQRATVQRSQGVEVVEFEALDERAVEHRRSGWAARPARADHDGVAVALQREHRLRRRPRPGQTCADQRAADAVQQQVLRSVEDRRRHVGEPEIGDPVRQGAGRALRIAGRVTMRHSGLRLVSCYIHITTRNADSQGC